MCTRESIYYLNKILVDLQCNTLFCCFNFEKHYVGYLAAADLQLRTVSSCLGLHCLDMSYFFANDYFLCIGYKSLNYFKWQCDRMP